MKNNNVNRILIVDDEPDVTELLKYKLEQDGNFCRVVNNPLSFISVAREFNPDLILLDIMMPELNGLQLSKMVRSDPKMNTIPIIFLSARGEVEDRIEGLESGGDDYIAKPFNTKELWLRIGKILDRKQSSELVSAKNRIQIAGVILDDILHELTVDGEAVILTATEFRLLKLLMGRKNRVQTRENLLVNVWNYETDIETRTVDTHVRRVREKLGPYANMIETIRGVGYKAVDI
jgi:two-component system phosphate regulon response regulator PhoB